MFGRCRIFGGVSALAVLAGCATTLDVQSDPGSAFSEGIPQVLPFTQFEMTATWRLAACDGTGATVILAVTAIPGTQDDPRQRYLIDSTSLQGPLTRSELAVTYHAGSNTIESINAEVEDRTAAVVTNVATALVNVAPLLMGAPDVGALDAGPRNAVPCNADTLSALATVASLQSELATMNEALASATDDVATLSARVARLGSAVDPETSKGYADALQRLDELTTSHAGLAGRLAAALEPVTYRTTVRWPENGQELERAAPLTIAPDALGRWGLADGTKVPRAFVAIEPSVAREARSSAEPTPGSHVAGIPYRVSAQGRLVACAEPCSTVPATRDRRTVFEGPVAQLGGVNVLPVRNPPLGSTAFAARFNRDGTLASAGYQQRNAPLEDASATLADATGRLAPLFDPTQRLARETEYLEALRAQRDAAAALQPAAPEANAAVRAALEAETILLNAQIANRQARITLRELESSSTPQ